MTPRPHFTPGKEPVRILQEAGWALGPVWTGAENLAPTGIRSPKPLARRLVAIPTELPSPHIVNYECKISVGKKKNVFCYVRMTFWDMLKWEINVPVAKRVLKNASNQSVQSDS